MPLTQETAWSLKDCSGSTISGLIKGIPIYPKMLPSNHEQL